MVAGEDAVLRDLAAVGREVRMQLHHRASGRNCIGTVYLDLVVVLGTSQSSQQHDYKNCWHANRWPSMVHRAQDRRWKDFHSSTCQPFVGASLGGNLVSGAVLDPDWRAQKSERSANLVFEETLIGEVQLHFAVSEDDESRRPDRGLGHIENSDLLPRGNGGPFEVDMLQEAIHLAGPDALPPFGGDFLQSGKYSLGAFAG